MFIPVEEVGAEILSEEAARATKLQRLRRAADAISRGKGSVIGSRQLTLETQDGQSLSIGDGEYLSKTHRLG